jgi:hypothetical protein
MRKRICLNVAMASAMGCAVIGAWPSPVTAATLGTGGLLASGSTSPGLTITPTAQSVSGGGTLVGAAFVGGNVDTVNDSCGFSGASGLQSTVEQSLGSVSASCSGTVAVSASLSYTRDAAVVVITGSGSINGAGVVVQGVCSFIPTSAPTIQTFDLQCALVADSV